MILGRVHPDVRIYGGEYERACHGISFVQIQTYLYRAEVWWALRSVPLILLAQRPRVRADQRRSRVRAISDADMKVSTVWRSKETVELTIAFLVFVFLDCPPQETDVSTSTVKRYERYAQVRTGGTGYQ